MRNSVCKVVCVVILLALAFFPHAALAADRPNVILVTADDLGWGDVGFNGNKTIRTPNLDAMAAGGLKLTRFYSAGPVCSPTRGSCLTGRHPHRYGIVGANAGHMKPQEITLAELLKAKGYATGHFGKWHLGTLTTEVKDANRGKPGDKTHFSPPQLNGFDTCFSTESKVPTWDPMRRPKKGGGANFWPALSPNDASQPYGTRYWDEKGKVVPDELLSGDDSRLIMDRAVNFIKSARAKEQPFFAVIWFHTPHLPVVAGPAYAAMYPGLGSYQTQYYGCITAMDDQTGRLRQTLRQLNVANDTLVCFASDNGPEGQADTAPGSAGPFRGRKRDLYEGGVRVPAIIEWPSRIANGSVSDLPAVTSDYLPTVLELIGHQMPDNRPIDGVSLVPLFDEKLKARPRPIGFKSGKVLAWHDERYKLINGTRNDTFELYDLMTDPGEKNDVSAAQPERVLRMRAALESWVKSCEASQRGEDY